MNSLQDNVLSLIKDTVKYLDYLTLDLSQSSLSLFNNEPENLILKKTIIPPQHLPTLNLPPKKNLPPLKGKETVAPAPTPALSSTPIQTKNTLPLLLDTPKELDCFTVLEKPSKQDFSFCEIKKMVLEIAPNLSISDVIPSDAKATQISNAWKIKRHAAEISILSFGENPQQILFLKNLATALDILSLPTKVILATDIEKENRWEDFFLQATLRLVIACDYSIWSLPNLIKYYKEIPSTQQHFLHNTPLFMLPDISLYFKDPLLKKSLWAALKTKIQILLDK